MSATSEIPTVNQNISDGSTQIEDASAATQAVTQAVTQASVLEHTSNPAIEPLVEKDSDFLQEISSDFMSAKEVAQVAKALHQSMLEQGPNLNEETQVEGVASSSSILAQIEVTIFFKFNILLRMLRLKRIRISQTLTQLWKALLIWMSLWSWLMKPLFWMILMHIFQMKLQLLWRVLLVLRQELRLCPLLPPLVSLLLSLLLIRPKKTKNLVIIININFIIGKKYLKSLRVKIGKLNELDVPLFFMYYDECLTKGATSVVSKLLGTKEYHCLENTFDTLVKDKKQVSYENIEEKDIDQVIYSIFINIS